MSDIKCPYCGSTNHSKNGTRNGIQQYKCRDCKKYYSDTLLNKQTIVPSPQTTLKRSNHMGIPLDEFRAKNDPNVIIKNGLKLLNKEKLYKTNEFMSMIGLPNSFGSSRLNDMTELDSYHGKCNGSVYWGHPEVIEQLKQETILK